MNWKKDLCEIVYVYMYSFYKCISSYLIYDLPV